MLRGQEQTLRCRLRARPLNAPFVIVLRRSRRALGIPLHPPTPVPLQAPTLHQANVGSAASSAGAADAATAALP